MKLSTFLTVLSVAMTVDGATRHSAVGNKFRGTGTAKMLGELKTRRHHTRRLMMSKGKSSSIESSEQFDGGVEAPDIEEPVAGVDALVEGLAPIETPTIAPSLVLSDFPSDGPSDIPSSSPSDGVGILVGPTLGPSESGSPSDLPSDVPSEMPSSLEDGEVRKRSYTEELGKLDLFGEDPNKFIPADSISAPSLTPSASPAPSDLPSLAPSSSPGPSGGPSDLPSGVPSGFPSDVSEPAYVVEVILP